MTDDRKLLGKRPFACHNALPYIQHTTHTVFQVKTSPLSFLRGTGLSFTLLKLIYWLALMLSVNSCYGSLVDELSLEEKVGQLLMVHFYGQSANEDSDYLIRDIGVGGIVYFNWCNELKSPMQVQHLSNTLQETAKATLHGIPLFISVD